MADKEFNVTNKRIEEDDFKAPSGVKATNVITVDFLNATQKHWSLRVESVSLENYDAESETYITLRRTDSAIIPFGTTCKSVDFGFEDDEVDLANGARFTMTVRANTNDPMKKHVFVLQDEEWVLKVE